MDWKFDHQRQLAYQVRNNLVIITGQVSWTDDLWVMVDADDDFDCNHFTVSPDGSLTMPDWIDLRQFNNSGDLMRQIELLNEITAQMNRSPILPLDPKVILSEPCIFKVEKTKLKENEDELYDLEAVIKIGENSYSLTKQFIKYTFIDEKICSRTWTVAELANFCVHMQKFLYDQEKQGQGDDFLQVDRNIEELISK